MSKVCGDLTHQIAANEGHVGETLLFIAVDSALDEAGGPLTLVQIAALLFAQGFPAGDSRRFHSEIRDLLRKHPEAFLSSSEGWSRHGAGPGECGEGRRPVAAWPGRAQARRPRTSRLDPATGSRAVER